MTLRVEKNVEGDLSRPLLWVRVAAVAATTIGGALGLLPWVVVCQNRGIAIATPILLFVIALLYQRRVPARARRPSAGAPLAAFFAAWFALSIAAAISLLAFAVGLGLTWTANWVLGLFSKALPFSGSQAGFWLSLLVAAWFGLASTVLNAREVNRMLFPDGSTPAITWDFVRRESLTGVFFLSGIGLLAVGYLLYRLLVANDPGLLDGVWVVLAAFFASSPGIAVSSATLREEAHSADESPEEAPEHGTFSLTAGPSSPSAEDLVRALFRRVGFDIEPVEMESRLTRRIDFIARRGSLVVPVDVATTSHAPAFDTALASSALTTASRVWATASGTAATQPMLVVVSEGKSQPQMQLGAVTVVGIDPGAMESALTQDDGAGAAAGLLHLSLPRET